MEQEKIKILLVENDVGVRKAVTRELRAAGFEVTGVSKLQDAIDVSREDNFNLVISDFHLDDGNGMDLYKFFRDAENQVFFVLMSAHPEISKHVAVAQARRDDSNFAYYEKPFSDVVGKVKKNLSLG